MLEETIEGVGVELDSLLEVGTLDMLLELIEKTVRSVEDDKLEEMVGDEIDGVVLKQDVEELDRTALLPVSSEPTFFA